MISPIPTKKLFKTAVYTSVLIGAILTIGPLAFISAVSVAGLFSKVLFHSFFIFLIWLVNLLLVYLIENYRKDKFSGSVRYILSYILCLPLIFLTKLLIVPVISVHDKPTAPFPFIFVILGLALDTIVLIIQDLVLLQEKKTKVEIENAELKVKNVEAANQQLKHQIHPHFLFNSLSTLKSLIKKEPNKAEDYLVKLSDFLRASLLSNVPNTIKLDEEIKLCHDYLEMQKMRFGEALQYNINIPEKIQDSVFVPAFSLLPLLENAIKHNKLTNELPLHITIHYENGQVITTNSIRPKLIPESSTGLGLENLAERYKILSGDKITITNGENIFSVSIKTLTDENSNYRR